MANSNLAKAKKAKNDEFYTQFIDIQKEVEVYLEYDADVFRGKVVYCNCDDPYESNFFCYFVLNFDKIGLKQLITTSYKPSLVANTQLRLFSDDKTRTKQKGRPKITANKFIINSVGDTNNDGEFNLEDVSLQLQQNKNNEWTPLKGDGDFRSDECIELLKQADIVVTNPPFSLFRDYVAQLMEYDKKFLIIGSQNALTYREIFPLIKENKVWWGNDCIRRFHTPKNSLLVEGARSRWFTNLDHGRRHQPIPLMTEEEVIKFATQKPFEKYDNYDAINVDKTKEIPSDYAGVMGVPITFLDNFCPEQFEIVGSDYYVQDGLLPELVNPNWRGKIDRGYINDKRIYSRILIKHKNPQRKK